MAKKNKKEIKEFTNPQIFEELVLQGALIKKEIEDKKLYTEALAQIFSEATPCFEPRDFKMLKDFIYYDNNNTNINRDSILENLIRRITQAALLAEYLDLDQIDTKINEYGFKLKRIDWSPWERFYTDTSKYI